MEKAAFGRQGLNLLLEDLRRKIVLLTGPRQVGKTWLAKHIMGHYQGPLYLNYDSFQDRKIIDEQSWPESNDLIIFDEIHKMDQWKNYIKGIFDTRPKHQSILVTGSARLQQMNRSGDSLAGRFFAHTLLPFSLLELRKTQKAFKLSTLLQRGGLPEPLLLAKNENQAQRWRGQYLFSLLREDIPDFKSIQHYKKMETLVHLLKEGVGSPLSIQSLSQSLKIDYKTVNNYLCVLEDLFIIFQVPSFAKNIGRSLSKAKKVYFYDSAVPEQRGARLENLVAMELLKYCTSIKESNPSHAPELAHLRTREQKEVDFLLTKKGKPQLMVEVKSKDVEFSKNLIYFHDKYGIPGRQLCLNLKHPRQMRGRDIAMENVEKFLLKLDGTRGKVALTTG